jgi:hypothetical protein
MESVVAVIVILLCLGVFVILLLKNQQLNKQVREIEEQILALVDRILEQRRDFDERHPGIIGKNEALETENRALKGQIEGLHDELNRMTDGLRRNTEELKKVQREIKELPVREWQEWLKGLTKLSCSGEIEVEVKFILPLVKYLGYHENDFTLRHAVYVQIGRKKERGQADWVLWDRSEHPPKARAIIEAKAPNQRLDNKTQEQARSYAFALSAPVYALTNGKRFQVFRCRVQGDTCVADCDVRTLGEVWPRIHQEMGVGPGIQG